MGPTLPLKARSDEVPYAPVLLPRAPDGRLAKDRNGKELRDANAVCTRAARCLPLVSGERPCPFARANILFYDERVIDLSDQICALYRVGLKVQKQGRVAHPSGRASIPKERRTRPILFSTTAP